ncbi:hypothetical protein [Corynebacterium sp.]|uniref:hypothetical protein n=1 Tax=Corynebacterium sp. TaxID=1720 RepID=UPI00261E1333|nr:hypothetical protein [Corynebacterium sp.]
MIENPKGSGSAKPGEEIALFCDGEWLHAAKYQTDFLWIEHYDGSRWQKVDYDGRNPGGLQSPCYSEAKLRKKGAPQELIDEIILCQ